MGAIIKHGATVYLDANAVIYLTEGDSELKASMEGFFAEIGEAGARIITSELTFTEVLVVPFRTGNDKLLKAYDHLLQTLVNPLPLGRKELFLAAQLRSTTSKLRTPDALHLATAILADADLFVTGDSGIDVPPPMRKYSI